MYIYVHIYFRNTFQKHDHSFLTIFFVLPELREEITAISKRNNKQLIPYENKYLLPKNSLFRQKMSKRIANVVTLWVGV